MNRKQHIQILTSILLAIALFAAGSQSCRAARVAAPAVPAAVSSNEADAGLPAMCSTVDATPQKPVPAPDAGAGALIDARSLLHPVSWYAAVAASGRGLSSDNLRMLKSVVLVI